MNAQPLCPLRRNGGPKERTCSITVSLCLARSAPLSAVRLPSILVLLGLGTTVASLLSAAPWLVSLSRHKIWTFSIAGTLDSGKLCHDLRDCSQTAAR